jgi:hypothetical protein
MATAVNTEPQEDHAFLVWDHYEIAKAHAQYLREEDPELSDDDAYEQAASDSDIFEHEWDFLLECLGDKMAEINEGESWYCEGHGLGWQKRSGHMSFSASDGRGLLENILPRTECTFRIYVKGEGDEQYFKIVNSHHDAMGEIYIIRKDTEGDEYE